MIGAAAGCQSENVTRDYAVNSDNIIQTQDGKTIFTANIDVNSVTFMDAKKKKVTAEVPVCKEPRQLTLSPDEEELYVTCMYDNKVNVISVEDKEVTGSIKTGVEPYGVVTSQDGELLYVANYRSDSVSVIDLEDEKTVKEIKTGNRPRTLAITADGGKLYVPEYLDAGIDVIDTKKQKVVKVIQLENSPDKKDVKKSQGIPNTLEQFVISPDGKTAWVPHMLTNVDTPVHFEETIFPAISVIDLKKDEELVDERKELFTSINVKDKNDKAMIVSNPYDVVFQKDGSKAYGLMSGSEDLVVFDLKRGGNAVQILRRIEGDNPRGMVLSKDGKSIYVHNAMSHDVATVATGGKSAFAQARLSGDNEKLIQKDSLTPLVRKGKKIFYSANSDEYATEITGNNWMSCASCHADGDINGLSIMTAKGLRNIPSNVGTTENGLFMWDGTRDDFNDYLLTVQGEMGGMTELDPGKPIPAEVQKMFDAMFAYLDDPQSFPAPKSPYRDGGKLSADAAKGKELFEKAGCISCHAGSQFTDSTKAFGKDGKLSTKNISFLHDIGTGSSIDKASKGDARAGFSNPRDAKSFDTPTLRGVYDTAPYFHDGSAKTLEEAISRHEYKDKPNLSKGEVMQITQYLKSIE
ncbi:beta-propeller fold lactonase family protein [Fictibacillus aquaticus]|uniref:Cytochrome c peroxidase n=1 Tax=Fictibacillus aquaticus TaxID=2021314 RepID=A0A235F928_9BACL|nr:cytochrome D1 domain-containing protein [Fictibacillus aquaticus]OYD57762.1 cytochrome c peroxidase [Fictibacillus aquaticus]